MKPIKSFEPISKWLLRFAMLAYILCLYFNQIHSFDFKNIYYLINIFYIIFCALLFIGGFQKNATLTIVSGLFIFLISTYKAYTSYTGNFMDTSLYIFVLLAGVGLFFSSKGNS